jgi:hypothetical protein
MLLSLLVEAAQIAVRFDPQFRKQYVHRCHQKPKGVAKVAAARKLAVRLYWMLRSQVGYPEIVRIESNVIKNTDRITFSLTPLSFLSGATLNRMHPKIVKVRTRPIRRLPDES